MAADAGDSSSDSLEIGSLDRTRTKRMKEIREQQDSGDSLMSNYPRTLKTRNDRLLGARQCKDDYYMRKSDSDEDEPIKINFKNCYLKSIDYLSDERKGIQTIKSLSKIGRDGLPKFKSLPIYLVNGHSSVEPRLILEPPEDMSLAAAKEEQEYFYIDQLEQSNFSLHISPSTNNIRFPARTDFFNTNARSNKFVVTTTPIGFDATCGDRAQEVFLKAASNDRFSSLRDALLSENFHEFFTRANIKSISSASYDDDDARYFQNTMFFPPGYSVVNKSYQFWDHDPNERTRDKWGVIRLDTLTEDQLSGGALDSWDPPITSANPQERLRTLHPLCHPKIKKTITDSILNETDVTLKEITDKLGAGIYLDFGCSGLVMKIFDPLNNKYKTISPDKKENIELFLPFYNVIQEGLEEINRYSKMSWNNIVSRKDDVELSEGQKSLARKSRRFKKDDTVLQRASQKSRIYTEKHMKGGKKKKRKTQKKRKSRRRKSRRRKAGNPESAKKIQKIVRGHQSRKKTIKRLSDNPFSGDHPENLLKTGSVIERENIDITSKTKLGEDVRKEMMKKARNKNEMAKRALLNDFPQFKEEINNVTSLERMLRQNSHEDYMTDAEKRARGLLGGRKRKTRRKRNKRKTHRRKKTKKKKKGNLFK